MKNTIKLILAKYLFCLTLFSSCVLTSVCITYTRLTALFSGTTRVKPVPER